MLQTLFWDEPQATKCREKWYVCRVLQVYLDNSWLSSVFWESWTANSGAFTPHSLMARNQSFPRQRLQRNSGDLQLVRKPEVWKQIWSLHGLNWQSTWNHGGIWNKCQISLIWGFLQIFPSSMSRSTRMHDSIPIIRPRQKKTIETTALWDLAMETRQIT